MVSRCRAPSSPHCLALHAGILAGQQHETWARRAGLQATLAKWPTLAQAIYQGDGPVSYACCQLRFGNLHGIDFRPVIQFLLDNGADPNARGDPTCLTALHYVVKRPANLHVCVWVQRRSPEDLHVGLLRRMPTTCRTSWSCWCFFSSVGPTRQRRS